MKNSTEANLSRRANQTTHLHRRIRRERRGLARDALPTRRSPLGGRLSPEPTRPVEDECGFRPPEARLSDELSSVMHPSGNRHGSAKRSSGHCTWTSESGWAASRSAHSAATVAFMPRSSTAQAANTTAAHARTHAASERTQREAAGMIRPGNKVTEPGRSSPRPWLFYPAVAINTRTGPPISLPRATLIPITPAS